MTMNTILNTSVDYQTIKNLQQSLLGNKGQKRKKKALKTDIIHNYVPEEAVIHNYVPEEAMKPWV